MIMAKGTKNINNFKIQVEEAGPNYCSVNAYTRNGVTFPHTS